MKISELQEGFLKYKLIDQDRSPKTIELYRDCLNRFIFFAGDLNIEEVTLDHLTEVKYRLKMQKASSYYISNIIFSFRALLRYCLERRGMDVLNPSLIKPPIIRDKNIIYYTNREVKLLMDCIDIDTLYGLRLRALCETLLGTGVRIDEALQLDCKSIKEDLVEIEKDGEFIKKKVFFAYVVGKGSKVRKIFFTDRSIFWINKYLQRRNDSCSALFITHRRSIHRLDYVSCPAFFRELQIKSGIDKPVHPHIFRHTFCSNLAKNGAEMALIQKMAGHSTVSVTIRFYADIDDRDIINTRMRCLNYDN